MKKFIILTLSLVLVVGLSACNKKSDEGKINDVEVISEENSDNATDNAFDGNFTRQDSPFGYQTKKIKSGMVFMNLEVPKPYKVNVHNARHLSLEAPSDDPNVPNATFHILYDFANIGGSLAAEEDTMHLDASTYPNIFDRELEKLKYNLNGNFYNVRTWQVPEEMTTGFSFANRKDSVFSSVAHNVVIDDTSTFNIAEGKYSQVAFYFAWDLIPCVIATVVPEEYTKNAEEIMKFIVSSCTYRPSKIDSQETLTLGNCSLSLPKDFKVKNNVAYSPRNKVSDGTAGITVGVFSIDKAKTQPLTETTMNETYGDQLAANMVIDKNYTVSAVRTLTKTSETISINSKETSHYYTPVSVSVLDEKMNGSSAGSFYGTGASYYMETLVIDQENEQKIITVWYTVTQYKDAQKILKAAASSASFT